MYLGGFSFRVSLDFLSSGLSLLDFPSFYLLGHLACIFSSLEMLTFKKMDVSCWLVLRQPNTR